MGPILAHGQTLRHEFTLTNPSEKPIRFLNATCFTSCCSAVESLPQSIAPHDEGKVAVVFKPGYQSGLKVARFAIETDSSDQPTRLLALRARLFSEWEITPLGDPVLSVPIGRTAKGTWRVVCRRTGSLGLRAPQSLKVGEPLGAKFTGPAEEQVRPGGVVEASRNVEVNLPAILMLGSQQAEIAFFWPDEHRETHVIRWEITPLVHVSPSSIIVEPSAKPIEHSVTITSDDESFRITKVGGDLLSAPVRTPSAAERTHHLTFWLDSARGVVGSVSSVVIGTDHPHHSTLTLRVLILPSHREKRGTS